MSDYTLSNHAENLASYVEVNNSALVHTLSDLVNTKYEKCLKTCDKVIQTV